MFRGCWINFMAHKRGKSGEAEIEAENQTCKMEHLSLWRDVYYTNRRYVRGELRTATPDHPVQLGPKEYFVMGDNSAISKDARWWEEPIDLPHEGLEMPEGRVPEQFLLGKAVFVYWPAGFQGVRSFVNHSEFCRNALDSLSR